MTESNKQAVGRGAAYIYFETVAAMISGYLLWIFLSKITTPEVIGNSSALTSMAIIFTTIASIGIPNGIQRFLGKCFAERRIVDAKMYTKASMILVFVGTCACSTILLVGKDRFFSDSDFLLVTASILLMGFSTMVILFRSILISSLKTKTLPITMIISSAVRISLTVVLVLIGAGTLGIIVAYLVAQIIASIPLGLAILTIFRSGENNWKKPVVGFYESSKSVLVAGIPSWVPGFITALGTNLGTIVVLGSSGASQAGTYFISFSIFSAIVAITYSLFSIAFPALSAMTDGRKQFVWRLTKMSLIISLPFSSSLLFFGTEVMGLFGKAYIGGSFSLQVLMLSALPTAIITGISTLVYSYGNYRQVLIIGLAASLPRTILYFVLVPISGGVGAALSFLIGSAVGLAVSLFIAKKIGFLIFWKELLCILIIPAAIAFIFSIFRINYLVSILMTLILSYILLLRLGIITRPDLQDSFGLLPKKISNPIINIVNALGKKINSSY